MIPTAPLARARPTATTRVGLGGLETPTGMLRPGAGLARYADAKALINAVRREELGAAVRGSLPARTFIGALGPEGRAVQRGVLLEPRPGRAVVLGPVGVAEGRTAKARTRFARDAARLLADVGLLTEDALVAVLAAGRPEDAKRAANIARSLAQAEEVGRNLEREGLDAFPAGVLLEDVLADSDIVVAPDGATGNLLFRALHLVGRIPSWGALCTGTRLTLVDSSRARKDYERPVRLAAYLASAAARGD